MYWINKQYHSHMAANAEIWIAACAHELQRRRRTLGLDQLEELAADLWQVTELRYMAPGQAAKCRLEPVSKLVVA